MEILSEKSSLQTTQQFAGNESIGTTRLILLKSWQADVTTQPLDKTWVIPKANRRSYMQSKITLQSLKIWNTFKSIPTSVDVVTPTQTITIFPGNWTPETLANFLTTKLKATDPADSITVSFDPYQFQFTFCPSITILGTSTALPYLGFPLEKDQVGVQSSAFPPVKLKGPVCINVWTNFTMDTIPFSEFLTCVPLAVPFGEHLFYSQYDDSQSVLSLDSDIQYIRISLRDDRGNLLDYPEELDWEVTLALQSALPEGFVPLEI